MEKSSKDVVPGAVFGRWTVLETNVVNPQSKAKKPPRMAFCQCICGRTRYKEYRDLYSGRSLSCGCLRNEITAERNADGHEIKVGTVFGNLTMIQDLSLRKQNSRDKNERWSLCKCVCGNTLEVRNNNLKTGMTKSCGCVNSYGEKRISEILRANNINFATQYSFNDLKGTRDGVLRFDFAVFDNQNQLVELIEFDGRHHYTGPEGHWTRSYTKEIMQENDRRKDEYCHQKGLKLVRIPYYDIDKLSLETLELSWLIDK